MRVLRKEVLETATVDYPVYRIPGLIVTDRGTMLVCYECRQGGDWSVIDLCMRKSADGGKTWSRRRLLVSGGGKNTTNNPVFFADGERIHFIWMENYKRAFYQYSLDEGETWSPAREITAAFEAIRPWHPWTIIAAGPGHGTRLSSGRLIVPVWLANDPTQITAHMPSVCATLYSDDRGQNWHMGEMVPTGKAVPSPNETALAELSDGRVLLNIRSKSENHLRCLAVSATGIDRWEDVRFDEQLIDPHCEGALCSFPRGILFSNCRSKTERVNLSLLKSEDDGAAWEQCLIEPIGAYSDVCYHSGAGTAFVAYEAGEYQHIMIAEIEL